MPDPNSITRSFISQLGSDDHFGMILDHLPNEVTFFAKNTDFRIVACNKAFALSVGHTHPDEVIGKDDYDLFPAIMADHFRAYDKRILESGEAIHKIVEPFFNQLGIPEWQLTDKVPLRDQTGNIIGLMGTTLPHEGKAVTPSPRIRKALDFIQQNFSKSIAIGDIADHCEVSVRQLERHFADSIGVSPKAFLTKTKVMAAAEKLRATDLPISDIATDVGFSDQSALTTQFKATLGTTPAQYRKA